ncbi:MAG: hypothetical protein EA355_07380 [Rhodobacteraceae bacterium]|nr:MAG: hypothetical protein EA355_07380 [Paracoccaceae bacterium]
MTTRALIALFILSAAPGATAQEWFTTADGVRLPTPAIGGLDCQTKRAVLDAIDASGYRAGAPIPRHAADEPLLDYEHQLSRAFYADCVRAATTAAGLENAFRGGYEGD